MVKKAIFEFLFYDADDFEFTGNFSYLYAIFYLFSSLQPEMP